MLVKIIKYDPVKGKGIYLKPDGLMEIFSYRQLKDHKMITVNRVARLTKEKYLCAAGWKEKIKWPISKLFKRKITWLS